jgi:drug/metabolite transporter (DMT)-like permease
MLFLILSILCSVTVGIIFKISRKYSVSITQIVAINYLFALLFCYLFFQPDPATVNASAPWIIYIPLMLLLPSVFVLLATSIKYVGIARTDVAQRLSLFIPILAAWFIFKEDFNSYKFIGLAAALPAILLILNKKSAKEQNNQWLYPALVLLGFGVIDVLFKQIALYTTLPYTTSLFVVFVGALAVSIIAVAYEMVAKGIRPKLINLCFGALVGIFNFGNILFYLKAHKAFADNPSTVFAAMNVGVIVLGCLAGVVLFKEKLNKFNYLGLLLALVAIAFITLSQLNK